MEITIFKDITTEGVITSIEENSAKYHEGFYADMSNAPERKLVKESSADIKVLIKELEAARIKINKSNTANVNAECKSIVDRLAAANAPFTVLEDEWKALRAKELADEKRVIELRAAMVKKEDDHEMALLINKTFEFDKAEELRVENEKLAEIQAQAAKQALINQERHNAEVEQNRVDAENARLANFEHVKSVNVAILNSMIAHGLPEHESKKFISTLARKKLNQLTINY